jgi:hypothetical protein
VVKRFKDSGRLPAVDRRADEMPPADLDMGGSTSQRQRHKVGSRESPMVHNCGKHDVRSGPGGQGRLGPSYFFISLVLVPLNRLVWWEAHPRSGSSRVWTLLDAWAVDRWRRYTWSKDVRLCAFRFYPVRGLQGKGTAMQVQKEHSRGAAKYHGRNFRELKAHTEKMAIPD